MRGPRARRCSMYSERIRDSPDGERVPSAEVEHESNPPSARTGYMYGNGLAAGGDRSMRADTIGGLALPLDLGRASRITRVEVDNLAMVDNVSIKVCADFGGVCSAVQQRQLPSGRERLDAHSTPATCRLHVHAVDY